ncbi:MAG TPA: protein kinase [Bryobacteraceae bacterium]|nr:protein kinase [Bryobacteraceae bacterium]
MELETICVNCMEDDSGSPICPKCGSPFNLPVNNLLLLPPRTLLHEQYLIGRALGHGGFGITYLAWDVGLQTRLAIKEYMPAGVAGRTDRTKVVPLSDTAKQEYEWGLERFLDEARVLKKSNHPNVVSVDTVFRDNGTAYLVMEYLDGMNFAEFLRRRGGTIPFADALRVMLPVMDALIAVHALNIVHRDVSPDNIYIPKTGKVKLIDFGAARNALTQKSSNLSAILKGGYTPEEQYRSSGSQGPWTDVYATAATLYRAITGKVPVPSLDRQAEDTLERPSQLGVAIPASAESALMKALAVRADDRFQTMVEFKRVLTGGVPAPRPGPITIPGEGPAAPVVQASALEEKIKKYESGTSESGPPPTAIPVRVRDRSAGRPLPKWMAPAIAGILVLSAGAGVLWFLKHRSTTGTSATLAEWPAQQAGIPQSDPERQQQLEAQPQAEQNPAALPLAAAPETAQPIAVQPPPSPRAPAGRSAAQQQQQQQQPPTPAPIPPPVVQPPVVVAPKQPAGPSYGDLQKQASVMLGNKQYAEAQALLNKAIALNPDNYQAYNSIAKMELYYMHQPAQAFDHYRAALTRGGLPELYVIGEHNAPGWLIISRGTAGFTIASDSAHSFPPSAVTEAKRNRIDVIKPGAKGRNTFHIRLSNGQNYNFSPGSPYPADEVDFILATIGP